MTGRLSQIGRQWTRLRELFDGPLDAEATPLEIGAAILDDLERRIQPVGGGRRVFPYNRIAVRVRQGSAGRPALQAVLDGLGGRLRSRLEELRCDIPHHIDVSAALVTESDDWPDGRLYSLDCDRADREVTSGTNPRNRSALQVAVLKGAATQEVYRFIEQTVYVGRTEEATDIGGHVRRNDVAFLDQVDGITETVGRAHARIVVDPQSGDYRVFDDGSSNGTWIVRGGTTIRVPPGDPRGVRVESGDEVRIGRGLIRISLESAPLSAASG